MSKGPHCQRSKAATFQANLLELSASVGRRQTTVEGCREEPEQRPAADKRQRTARRGGVERDRGWRPEGRATEEGPGRTEEQRTCRGVAASMSAPESERKRTDSCLRRNAEP
ncbi:hypothetical protein CRG98_017461 [Punica granatum]|uniref:Uncharacterized protein n=1 Tax=Punica granatum TaxID=22663 RepID=A0A2I0K0K2_PUNGR|nr:hypothetical protein CRG98_017461 [Punica granatum]